MEIGDKDAAQILGISRSQYRKHRHGPATAESLAALDAERPDWLVWARVMKQERDSTPSGRATTGRQSRRVPSPEEALVLAGARSMVVTTAGRLIAAGQLTPPPTDTAKAGPEWALVVHAMKLVYHESLSGIRPSAKLWKEAAAEAANWTNDPKGCELVGIADDRMISAAGLAAELGISAYRARKLVTGLPCMLVNNPHYASAAPMKLVRLSAAKAALGKANPA